MRQCWFRVLVCAAILGTVGPVSAARFAEIRSAVADESCEKTSLMPAPMPDDANLSQATFEPVAGQARTSQVPLAGGPPAYGSGEGALPFEVAPRPMADATNQGVNMPSVPMAVRAAALPAPDGPGTLYDDATASSEAGGWPAPSVMPAEADPSSVTRELTEGQPAADRQPGLALASDATPARSERCDDGGPDLAASLTPDGQLTVDAHGFAGGETVSFSLGGQPVARLGEAPADADGNLDAVALPLPAPLPPNIYEMTAVGQTSGRSARVNLVVTPD